MECKHCGGKIEENHQFCPFCGEKIEKEVVVETVSEAAPIEEIKEIKEIKEVVQEEIKQTVKRDVTNEGKEKPKSGIRFGTLLFSIMFLFSVLAIAMVVQLTNELQLVKHDIYSLHQRLVSDSVASEQVITGKEVNITHIGHFSNGDTHTILFNVDVPQGVFFKGVPVENLTKEQEKAFATELIKTSLARMRAESIACYPNLEIQLSVNQVPYAVFNGQDVSFVK